MKTFHPKLADAKVTRKWLVIDAEGQILGKIATRVADVLRGRHKATWHPSIDCGDNVIIINAKKVVLTGQKEANKEYIRHTGFPGGIKRVPVFRMREEHPERLLEKAISGMLPKNRLRRHFMEKLHVYSGAEHPHAGQDPQPLTLR